MDIRQLTLRNTSTIAVGRDIDPVLGPHGGDDVRMKRVLGLLLLVAYVGVCAVIVNGMGFPL